MVSAADIRGVFPALVTPFTKKDQVDLKGVETITQFLIGKGVHALMPVGGTGEFPSLLREEKRDVVAAEMVKLYDLALAGRHEEALALSMKLQALNRYLEYDPGYVVPAKEALNLLGLPGGCLRGPLPKLTAAEKAGVKAALKSIGAL